MTTACVGVKERLDDEFKRGLRSCITEQSNTLTRNIDLCQTGRELLELHTWRLRHGLS